MKVLFLIGSLNQGGAEFQLLKFAELFQKKGNEITILALTDYDFYLDFVEENELPYQHLQNNTPRWKRVLQVAHRIRQFQPEVVVSYLREVSLVAVMAKLLSRHRFRLVIGERTSLIIPNYDRFYFQICRLAGAITVNSITKKVYIEQNFSFLNKKLFFTPNILSLEEFHWASKKPKSSSIKLLGYVGRISKEKNLVNLVKALGLVNEYHKDWTLEMYGAARDEGYLQEIFEHVERLGLTNKIKYCGVTKDVQQVYKRIDALCLLSIFEGFSNVLSEALCSGIPIVASNIEENAFLVEDDVNGFLIERYDVENIADGLRQLFSLDSTQINYISAKNRKKARDLFDEENTYQRLLNIVQPQ